LRKRFLGYILINTSSFYAVEVSVWDRPDKTSTWAWTVLSRSQSGNCDLAQGDVPSRGRWYIPGIQWASCL